MKNIATIFFCSFLIFGCLTKSKCNALFPPSVEKETITTIIRKDSIIKGGTVRDSVIIYDSLVIKQLTERVTEIHDTSNNTLLRYYIDENGKLILECQSKDRLLSWLEKTTENNTTETRTKTDYWPWIFNIITLVFMVFLSIKISRKD
jgi:hypothetical protein